MLIFVVVSCYDNFFIGLTRAGNEQQGWSSCRAWHWKFVNADTFPFFLPTASTNLEWIFTTDVNRSWRWSYPMYSVHSTCFKYTDPIDFFLKTYSSNIRLEMTIRTHILLLFAAMSGINIFAFYPLMLMWFVNCMGPKIGWPIYKWGSQMSHIFTPAWSLFYFLYALSHNKLHLLIIWAHIWRNYSLN